jgi:hypothetical protein
MNNKARHNLSDAKCRWRSNGLDGAGSFWEPLGQTQVMQIRHDFCCLLCQYTFERNNNPLLNTVKHYFDIFHFLKIELWYCESGTLFIPEAIIKELVQTNDANVL